MIFPTTSDIMIYLHSNMFLLRRCADRALIQCVFWFTFQYVSIKTTIWLTVLVAPLPYLHSNMFLLRPSYACTVEHYRRNLHSNMFLLRPCRMWALHPPVKAFTFQYVSIKTLTRAAADIINGDLHSNMFLLRLKKNWKKPVLQHIYIPICFY